MQGVMAEQALTDFEVELGLKSPEKTPDLGDGEGPRTGRREAHRHADELGVLIPWQKDSPNRLFTSR